MEVMILVCSELDHIHEQKKKFILKQVASVF